MSQRGTEGALLLLYGAVYSGEFYIYLDCPPDQPFFSILASPATVCVCWLVSGPGTVLAELRRKTTELPL